jgi:hypothetical protein
MNSYEEILTSLPGTAIRQMQTLTAQSAVQRLAPPKQGGTP